MSLEKGFAYIDPSIQVYLMYGTNHNFMGRPVHGYETHTTGIISQQAADALLKAQQIFLTHGYRIVVFDAYRPQCAVNAFLSWSQDPAQQEMKALFYPHLDKKDLFALGYIAKKSGHTRGSAVDLTLIEKDKTIGNYTIITLPNNVQFMHYEGTLDMGIHVDYFGALSHTHTDEISDNAKQNRALLSRVMEACGFEGYSKEWWHFKLKDEPFPDQYFDFPIQP